VGGNLLDLTYRRLGQELRKKRNEELGPPETPTSSAGKRTWEMEWVYISQTCTFILWVERVHTGRRRKRSGHGEGTTKCSKKICFKKEAKRVLLPWKRNESSKGTVCCMPGDDLEGPVGGIRQRTSREELFPAIPEGLQLAEKEFKKRRKTEIREEPAKSRKKSRLGISRDRRRNITHEIRDLSMN